MKTILFSVAIFTAFLTAVVMTKDAKVNIAPPVKINHIILDTFPSVESFAHRVRMAEIGVAELSIRVDLAVERKNVAGETEKCCVFKDTAQ